MVAWDRTHDWVSPTDPAPSETNDARGRHDPPTVDQPKAVRVHKLANVRQGAVESL
jgi:hypothetical protein